MHPDRRDEIIFNMGIAIRRLLLKVDEKSSAAQFANEVLTKADRLLKSEEADHAA